MEVLTLQMKPSEVCISPIAEHVYPFLQSLARSQKQIAYNQDCAHDRPFAHQRMLAAFGQCTGTPNFVINLSDEATDIMQWICLYSSAIRCSMGNCATGFVFIDWKLPSDTLPRTMLLWFDNTQQHQLLIDPSGTADAFHTLFNKRHIWDPRGTAKMFEMNLIHEFQKCLNRNTIYRSDADTVKASQTISDYSRDELELRCDDATFLVLIAWTCLRFGYKNIADVTRAIICAFCEHQRQYPEHFLEFWDLIRVWRNELRQGVLTHDDLLYLLRLKVVNNDKPCGYQMDNGQACTRPGHEDNVWCEDHQPQSMMLKATEHRNMSQIPMFPLPDNVARLACQPIHLQATAYFEERWKETNWECSWNTFELQKQQATSHDRCNRIGCLRFVAMHEKLKKNGLDPAVFTCGEHRKQLFTFTTSSNNLWSPHSWRAVPKRSAF